MGNEKSKEEKNIELQKIGEKANKDSQLLDLSIKITNDMIVSDLKTNPEKEYKMQKHLGDDVYGSIYSVINKLTGEYRVMKILDKSKIYTDEAEKKISREISILKTMDHPNILKIFEFYSTSKTYNIVIELCSGGTLFEELSQKGNLEEKSVAYIIYQLLSAIYYCHKMNIIHRDLNPENILISKRENNYLYVKIGGFDTAKMNEEGIIEKKIKETSYYFAPEIISNNYDEKCDLWSIGVIMYLLLSGRLPFSGGKDNEIIENIMHGKYDIKISPFNNISIEAIDLIKNLLIVNPKGRISAKDALNHIWFQKLKIKELLNEIKNKTTIKKLLDNLKNYKSHSIIQETSLAYLVHNFPQLISVVNACKLFNSIDVDNDGKINWKELYNSLKDVINNENLENDCKKIFKKLDMDNNGYIQYEEFVRAAVNKRKFLEENILKFAFKYFDIDENGEISFDEIEKVFTKSVSDPHNVHIVLFNIISEVDSNTDGKISFEEFCLAMQKLLQNN